MNKILTVIAICGIAASASVVAENRHACVNRPAMQKMPEMPPEVIMLGSGVQSYKFSPMKLFSVRLPDKSTGVWEVQIAQQEEGGTVIRNLNLFEFQHILNARRGSGPQFAPLPDLPRAEKADYFFASLRPGHVSVFFTNTLEGKQQTYRVQIEVSSESMPERIASNEAVVLQQWTDQDQDKTHELRYGDIVEITLPGSAHDDWDTSDAEKGGLKLRRKKAGLAGFVKLSFSVGSSGKDSVEIFSKSNPNKVYRFKLRFHPRPNC